MDDAKESPPADVMLNLEPSAPLEIDHVRSDAWLSSSVAVRTAEESRPDVIVMDVMMPNCLVLSLGVSQDSLPRLMRDWQT